jgi:hypothetical protein
VRRAPTLLAACVLTAFGVTACVSKRAETPSNETVSLDRAPVESALARDALARIEALDPIATSPASTIALPQQLANGAIAIEAWTAREGAVHLRLSHADAWSEVGQPLALGELRIACDPPLPTARFSQRCRRVDGAIEIDFGTDAAADTGDPQRKSACLRIVVDPESPHVLLSLQSEIARTCEIRLERWRDAAREVARSELPPWAVVAADAPDATWSISADIAIPPETEPDAVVWYHRNERSIMPAVLEARGLGAVSTEFEDPFLMRSFGARIDAHGFERDGERALRSTATMKEVHATVTISCVQADDMQGWLKRLRVSAGLAPRADEAADRARRWWRERWSRGWIVFEQSAAGDVGDEADEKADALDARNGALISQRVAFLARGRGAWPRGSRAEPEIVRWNETCASLRAAAALGDVDRVRAAFESFARIVPALRASTRATHGIRGVLVPPETTVFGLAVEPGLDTARSAATTAALARLFARSLSETEHAELWARALEPFLADAAAAIESVGVERLDDATRAEIVDMAREWTAHDGPLRARWTQLADGCKRVESEEREPRGTGSSREIDGALGSLLPLLLEHELDESGALRLLPAWPRAWNASFRVHSGRGAVLGGRVRDWRLESLEVVPPDAVVELGSGWSRPARPETGGGLLAPGG